MLTILLAASVALADGRVECASVPSRVLGRAVRYCALLPPSYDVQTAQHFPVLYYLHGLGDNEQSLVNGGGWNVVERLRERGKLGEFLIVTPDGDRSFYVNSHPAAGGATAHVRYEDFFMQEFMPAIERRYRVRSGRASRAIAGISMGGYGALRLAFKYPRTFSAVAVHMPALYESVPPFLRAASGVPGMRAARLDMGGVFGAPFDEHFWEANSPFTLARQNAAALETLRIYFDCGDQDEYGFDVGARALDRLLTARGVAHEFHIYGGGHNWPYVMDHFGDGVMFAVRAFRGHAGTGKNR